MLGERLARLRGYVDGLSNSELDRLCGLRKGHTWALEHNEGANPELNTLRKIAGGLGCTVGYLATGQLPEPDAETVQGAVVEARKRYEHKEPPLLAGESPEVLPTDPTFQPAGAPSGS